MGPVKALIQPTNRCFSRRAVAGARRYRCFTFARLRPRWVGLWRSLPSHQATNATSTSAGWASRSFDAMGKGRREEGREGEEGAEAGGDSTLPNPRSPSSGQGTGTAGGAAMISNSKPAVRFPLLASILTLPAATAVTVPSSPMVARAASALDQVTA